MTALTNYQWILSARPRGLLKPADLNLRESPVPVLREGQCLIKLRYIAMDPATRGWIADDGGYLEPLPLGGPVLGVTVGDVIESKNPAIKAGLVVAGVAPWAKYIVVDQDQMSSTRTGRQGVLAPMDTSTGHDLSMYLHAMGTSGGTAYYGLLEVAAMKTGDAVLVSTAGGSVGSLVGQIARLKGASRVVGLAGGAEKCADVVNAFGFDACIEYKATDDLSAAIAEALPGGLDVYFDNVGGRTLEAALNNLAKGARIAVCGMISQYNASSPEAGPGNLWNLLVHTARIEGFLVSDYFGTPECEAAYAEMSGWLHQGKMVARVDVRDDFEHIVDVYNLLFSGGHNGRLLVRVPD
ncbi:MAG: NADP-dependent oxidoreductase [Parahaliea sp.]